MSLLVEYGWNSFFQEHYNTISDASSYLPARVISVHRTQYSVLTDQGVIIAEISGNRLKNKDVYSKPFVGDFVLLRLGRGNDANIIEHILPRQTILERKKVHREDIQVMATNVAVAVLVQSVDQDFSPARLERMLVQLQESRIKPVIVFNKADLKFDKKAIINAISNIQKDMPIVFTSLTTGEGIEEFHSLLQPGETIVVVGSSGVGKSSLINTLLDENNQQKTGEISEYSGKGMHTTTIRTLIRTHRGILIIDTPGVREFGITLDDEESIREVFSVIEQFAPHCKFRDCFHKDEPSCAVQAAIDEGKLSMETLENYWKLKDEVKK